VNVEAGLVGLAGADAPGARRWPVVDAAPPALKLLAVSKRWRRKARPVLNSLDLNVTPGTAVLLTGRNDAGKISAAGRAWP
jgi:ABC-type molybdenum transport system ATPase subunit/photorepair protein PhrA